MVSGWEGFPAFSLKQSTNLSKRRDITHMEQYVLTCRHCVDEAAQNGSLEFTLTDLDGSPSESLCPRHLLTDKLYVSHERQTIVIIVLSS